MIGGRDKRNKVKADRIVRVDSEPGREIQALGTTESIPALIFKEYWTRDAQTLESYETPGKEKPVT